MPPPSGFSPDPYPHLRPKYHGYLGLELDNKFDFEAISPILGQLVQGKYFTNALEDPEGHRL